MVLVDSGTCHFVNLQREILKQKLVFVQQLLREITFMAMKRNEAASSVYINDVGTT